MVGQPIPIESKEGQLGDAPRALVDGAVGIAPVYREPQPLPERFVVLLLLLAHRETALDKSTAPNLGRSDAQPSLYQALGRQAIVIVAHRIENVAAIHTPEAGHEVGLAVGVDVSQVETPRDRRRGRVNRVDGPRRSRVEVVDA